MNKVLLSVLVASMVFTMGCNQAVQNTDFTASESSDVMEDKGDSMAGDALDDKGDSMEQDTNAMEDNDDTMEKDSNAMEDKGDAMQDDSASTAPEYKRYTKAEFDAAKAEGRPVMLFFYANWCPTCAQQRPVNLEAFANPEMPQNAIAFQAHYNDSETNDEDRAIAQELGVAYQHTQFVYDTHGEQIHKSTGFISEETIISVMKQASGA